MTFQQWLQTLLHVKPQPQPQPQPQPVGDYRDQLLRFHNDYRNPIIKLKLNDELNTSAQYWSDWMARYRTMVHETLISDLKKRVEAAGYKDWSSLAENIAAGQPTVEAVMTAWKNSPPHRANILSNNLDVGFGMSKANDGTIYWCANFGKKGIGSTISLSGPLS